MDTIKRLLPMKTGNVLVEYGSRDHPERVFYDILTGWRKMGITPLVVDVWDTLHIFLQNLRFSGMELEVDDVPVIKERGRINSGMVIGRVDVIEDFERHIGLYSRVAKKVPERSRDHTIVLGVEKFSFTFLDDPPKVERYFEVVHRRYLPLRNYMAFLFLNTDVASEYLTKRFEQDSEYVLRVSGREVSILKSPGVVE
ncbi:hypothetical protein A3L12_00240 [Thermococcus sp. P6]|nr:hypothetical protein A3L12_00240 [Thermococcus sp. P6]